MEALERFLELFLRRADEGSLAKLTLSKTPNKQTELKAVYVRPVMVRDQPLLSFTLRYAQRDETQNYTPTQAVERLKEWLGVNFLKADLFSIHEDASLLYNKKRKARLFIRPASKPEMPDLEHDRQKKRLLTARGQAYLQALGITGPDGKVRKSGQRKFRQINRYIEIIDSLLQQHPLPSRPHLVDMGSGKGYLTFALYDYLTHERGLEVSLTGIELREHLVEEGNALAAAQGFSGLQFISTDIAEYEPERIDMLIALHACDTATDLAIAKGIAAQAQIIVVAPCCHKQIRKQMQCHTSLQAILQHGILAERQAEMITDGLRALLMERQGYRTRIFEFIATEHTPKNVMIVGTKADPDPGVQEQIDRLKSDFGIEYHYLEKLLGNA